MKPIRDLEKALNNPDYYNNQFQESGIVKNILFVSPQLSANHIYKYILPYFCLLGEKVATAITSVEKFDAEQGLKNPKSKLFPQQVIWADYIVFPFGLTKLGGAENSFYHKLKEINPKVKIVFHVDFNFYLLSKMHPYYKLFDTSTISIVEDNIYFSDLCLVANTEFHKYLIAKISSLAEEKYQDHPPKLKVGCIPILFDTNTLLFNVVYLPEESVVIDNRKVKDAVETAEEEKKKPSNKKSTTKKVANGKSRKKSTTVKPKGAKSNGAKSNGTKSNGTNSVRTKSNGEPTKSNGTTTNPSTKRGRPKKSENTKS